MNFMYAFILWRDSCLLQVICSVCDTEQPVYFSDPNWNRLLEFSSLFLLYLWLLYCLSGCSSLHKLWSQYGGILLWNLQILWWWCTNYKPIHTSFSNSITISLDFSDYNILIADWQGAVSLQRMWDLQVSSELCERRSYLSWIHPINMFSKLILSFLYFSFTFQTIFLSRVGGREKYFHCKKCGMHHYQCLLLL